jgi:hypothetical protein
VCGSGQLLNFRPIHNPAKAPIPLNSTEELEKAPAPHSSGMSPPIADPRNIPNQMARPDNPMNPAARSCSEGHYFDSDVIEAHHRPRRGTTPRLPLRPRQQGARHPGDTGLAWPSVDYQHGRLHGAGTEPVQGFLTGVIALQRSRLTDLDATV